VAAILNGLAQEGTMLRLNTVLFLVASFWFGSVDARAQVYGTAGLGADITRALGAAG
jgi:hypothetical protein